MFMTLTFTSEGGGDGGGITGKKAAKVVTTIRDSVSAGVNGDKKNGILAQNMIVFRTLTKCLCPKPNQSVSTAL